MAQTTTLALLMALCLLSITSHFSFAKMASNRISAAPALLPTPISSSPLSSPLSPDLSPALSPDITPLFPSPSGGKLSPSDSVLPTIPSSPSPPNPDDTTSFGPNTMAISPSGSLPVSSSFSIGTTSIVMVISLGTFWSFIF